MDESTISFINREQNFLIDLHNKRIILSSIFDWYSDDFIDWLKKTKHIEEPHILDYIKLYYHGNIDRKFYLYDIEYFDYDWQLNDLN